jgi:hypothetical protein
MHLNSLPPIGTCSPRQVDPTGEWKECKQSLMWDDNCSVNLASQGHCTGVFIGTRVSIVPRQGRLCPRVPGLSPKYSHKGRLQTIITKKLLQMRPVICLSMWGPLQWANSTWVSGRDEDTGLADFVGVWPSPCNGEGKGQPR